MAYRITSTLGAAALVLGCLGVAPAFAQETATPASGASADKEGGGPMHHSAMHPHMHGKMHSHMMHGKMSGASMAEGKSMQGVRSQDMGTDALNNQSLHAAQSNTAFTPTAGSTAMSGDMHSKMGMHGKAMSGAMDKGAMGDGSMGSTGAMDSGSMTGGSMGSGSMGSGSMGSGSMGSGAMSGGTMDSGSMGGGAMGAKPMGGAMPMGNDASMGGMSKP